MNPRNEILALFVIILLTADASLTPTLSNPSLYHCLSLWRLLPRLLLF